MEKYCDICKKEIHIGYRIQTIAGKVWIFVCGKCCLQSKKGEYYKYGGTRKSKEKRKGLK